MRQTNENKHSKIMKSNLLKILNDLQMNAFSRPTIYNLQTGQINPDYGFAVGVEGTERSYPDLFDEILRDYLREFAIVLSVPKSWVYVEKLNDVYRIQVCEIHEDIQVALKLGILRNQKSIWWNAKNEDVNLPSAQLCGKDDQKEGYATLTAEKLVLELTNTINA